MTFVRLAKNDKRDLIQQMELLVTRLVQAMADAEFWHDRWLDQVAEERQRRVSTIEARYQQTMSKAKKTMNR